MMGKRENAHAIFILPRPNMDGNLKNSLDSKIGEFLGHFSDF